MSRENVEIARRVLGAIRRRNYGDAASCFHADIEWHNTSAFPGQRTIVGHSAIAEFWGELYQSFDDEGERAIIEKVAAGGDRVVIGVHSWGRGKASGVPVDVRWAIAFQFRDGKVSRIDVRGDYTEAVRAAGA